MVVLVSGKSRNIVLVKLRDFDKCAEEEKKLNEDIGDDIILDEQQTSPEMLLPKVCEY